MPFADPADLTVSSLTVRPTDSPYELVTSDDTPHFDTGIPLPQLVWTRDSDGGGYYVVSGDAFAGNANSIYYFRIASNDDRTSLQWEHDPQFANNDILQWTVPGFYALNTGDFTVNSTGAISLRCAAGSTISVSKPIQPVNVWTKMTLWQNGWSVGSPAPEWLKDAAGVVHFRGRINAGTLTSGTVITPSGGAPPNNTESFGANPAYTGGRQVVATDAGVGQMFVGSGLQIFNIPAGTTTIHLDSISYHAQ